MSVSKKTFGAVLEEAAKELVNDDVRFAHSIDTSKTVVSEKTLRRVRRQIKNYDTTPVRARTLSFRRAVAAVLVVCILSFGLCMSIDAVREKIIDTIISWYDKFVSVFYVSEGEYPEVIEEYKEPTLIPEGTKKEVVIKTDKTYYLKYNLGDETIVSYQQMSFTEYSNDIDFEKCIVEEVDIYGNDAKIFSYNKDLMIIWHDNEYRYLLFAYTSIIDTEHLINMAKSVK